jgi:hypothetical protein
MTEDEKIQIFDSIYIKYFNIFEKLKSEEKLNITIFEMQ